MPSAEAENREVETRRSLSVHATTTSNLGGIAVRRIAKEEVRREAKKHRPAPSGNQSHGSKKAKLKLPWCSMFNKNNCTNTRVGPDGCRANDGKVYIHSCNVPIDADGTKCGSYDHNARTHK